MTKQILKAAQLLQQGHVVAIPTETVYGLAANAFDEKAIQKIYQIKERPLYNPLIVHIKSIDYLDKIASNIPPIAIELAKRFWPGPLTLVLSKKDIIPNIVTSGKNTVGVRMPAHDLTLKLLHEIDFPLAAPSANPFGYISPTSSLHVKQQLGDKIPMILEGGPCEKGIESTIIGFENGKPILYRVGAISQDAIEDFIGEKISSKTKSVATPEAPGMLSKHYSPKTKFIVSTDIAKSIKEHQDKKIGLLLFQKQNFIESNVFCEILSNTSDINEAARNLYAAMHVLDAGKFDIIIAEEFPNTGLGISINDRLCRAQETKHSNNNLKNS